MPWTEGCEKVGFTGRLQFISITQKALDAGDFKDTTDHSSVFFKPTQKLNPRWFRTAR